MVGYVRVRMRKDSNLLSRYRGKVISRKLKPVKQEEVAAEVKKHLADIKENQRKK